MGDRANICVDWGKDGKVFLYSHWAGERMPVILQAALARGVRWDDPQYLARIIFCEMVKGSEGDETGYGISPVLCDNGHPILVVDCVAQSVRIHSEEEGRLGAEYACWPFAGFVARKNMSWATLAKLTKKKGGE